jgi:hypothetical protein
VGISHEGGAMYEQLPDDGENGQQRPAPPASEAAGQSALEFRGHALSPALPKTLFAASGLLFDVPFHFVVKIVMSQKKLSICPQQTGHSSMSQLWW